MKGFTLLEMLLATALMSVLMVGVLAVISTLEPASGVNGLALAEGSLPVEAFDAWVTLLREDLSHSRDARLKENLFELSGYLGLDARNRQRTHHPARVEYRLEKLGGRQWLVRVQTALDEATNENVRRDLVCCGVTRFAITRVSNTHSEPMDGALSVPRNWQDVGGVWRLCVWTDDREQPGYDRLMIAFPK
jgi:prepilin-type N-terminal cleavage/methylation domain-containing protein